MGEYIGSELYISVVHSLLCRLWFKARAKILWQATLPSLNDMSQIGMRRYLNPIFLLVKFILKVHYTRMYIRPSDKMSLNCLIDV